MNTNDRHVQVVKSSINNPEWSNKPLLYYSGGITFDLMKAKRFPDINSAKDYLDNHGKGSFLKVLVLEFDSKGNPIGLGDPTTIENENTYLIGCCTNIDCTEFAGGWKYPHDYPEDEQKECFCPGCGDSLEFIEQSDES